jgi:hypothetical protein
MLSLVCLLLSDAKPAACVAVAVMNICAERGAVSKNEKEMCGVVSMLEQARLVVDA